MSSPCHPAKLLVVNDLHLEFGACTAPDGLDQGVVVPAGDIHSPGTATVTGVRGQVARASRDGTGHRRFTAADSRFEHRLSRIWLRRRLAEHRDVPTVVVTHHAPSRRCVAPAYEHAPLSAALGSNLLPEYFACPVPWVHGPMHQSLDIHAGAARIVCDPRGYPTPSARRTRAWTAAGINARYGKANPAARGRATGQRCRARHPPSRGCREPGRLAGGADAAGRRRP